MKKFTLFLLLFHQFFIHNMVCGQRLLEIIVKDYESGEILNYPIVIIDGEVVEKKNNQYAIENELPDSTLISIRYAGYFDEKIFLSAENNYLILLRSPIISLKDIHVSRQFINRELQVKSRAIKLISRNMLLAQQESNIMSALHTQPGIFVHSGALNTNRLTIRGIGSRSLYATRKIRAFLNGIPLTGGDGETTIEDIDPELLQEVIVLKGPSSITYGAGLGGAILMNTKKIKDGLRLNTGFSIGSFGLMKNKMTTEYGSKKVNFFLGYHRIKSNGYRENNEYSRNSLTTFGSLQLNKYNKISLFGTFIKLKAFIPSSLDEPDYLMTPKSAAFAWKKTRGFEEYFKQVVGINHFLTFGNFWSISSSLSYVYKNAYEVRPFNILDDNLWQLGGRTEIVNHFSNKNWDIRNEIGVEFFYEDYEWQTIENVNGKGEAGIMFSNQQESRNFVNTFLKSKLNIKDRLTISAGLNYNQTNYMLVDQFQIDSINLSGNYRFRGMFSPRIAMNYLITKSHTFFVNASHGFSPPSLEETLLPDGQINSDIEPETGWNFEVGFRRGNDKRWSLESSLYTMRIRNLLVAHRVDEDQFIGLNAGKTVHTGVELSSNYHIIEKDKKRFNLTAFINYDLSLYRFVEFENLNQDYSGNQLTGVPRHKATMRMDGTFKNGIYFQSQLQIISKIPLTDSNDLYSDRYFLLGVKGGYKAIVFSKIPIELFFNGQNLTNTKYASMLLINAKGFGGNAPRYYYPGLPINWNFGIKLGFDL